MELLAIEKIFTLQPSPHLNGIEGTNRAPIEHLQIAATNDYEAICSWLNEYKSRDTTYRSYRKEAERLLLWCVVQQHKALASLDRQDFEAYFIFLLNPEPKSLWCGSKGSSSKKRGSKEWRPFVKGLSKSAQAHSISVIHSLMSYLVDAHYLRFNPLTLMRSRLKTPYNTVLNERKRFSRMLEDDEWQAILQVLHEMQQKSAHERDEYERLRFILSLLFLLGLRINELVTHTWQAFQQIQGQWWFFVCGKGNKEAKIPVNDHLLKAVMRYRQHLQMTPLPNSEEMLPLIISWRSGTALGARQINNLLKKLALQAAQQFTQPEKINKLRAFSAHWLRHLSASMQDAAGIDFTMIQENHRHQNSETTRRYVHAQDKARHNAMQKLILTFKE